MPKAWSHCGFCKQEIFRSEYEKCGQALHIGNNGHYEPKWFCDIDCLLSDLRQHLLAYGKIKCQILKPFGAKKHIKIALTIINVK